MDQSQAAHQLGGEVALLRAERGASGEGDPLAPVHGAAIAVGGDERGVPGRLDVVGDLVEHEVPRDALPAGCTRGPVLRRLDAAWRDGELHRGRTLRTEPSLVDRAVRVALDLQQLRGAVALLPGVGDERATDRAVRTDAVQLLGSGDAQVLFDTRRLGDRDVEAEARSGHGARAGDAYLEEFPTCDSRQTNPPNNLTLAQVRANVKFQPVDIRRSPRSSASGLRRRSINRGSHETITPVAPAASCSPRIAAQPVLSAGIEISTQVSPSGSPTTRRPRL